MVPALNVIVGSYTLIEYTPVLWTPKDVVYPLIGNINHEILQGGTAGLSSQPLENAWDLGRWEEWQRHNFS